MGPTIWVQRAPGVTSPRTACKFPRRNLHRDQEQAHGRQAVDAWMLRRVFVIASLRSPDDHMRFLHCPQHQEAAFEERRNQVQAPMTGEARAASWVLQKGVDVVRCQCAISADSALISIVLISADRPVTIIQRCPRPDPDTAQSAVSIWREVFLRCGWREGGPDVLLRKRPDRRLASRTV